MKVIVFASPVEPHSQQHWQRVCLIREAGSRCTSCGQPVESFYDHGDGDDGFVCAMYWGSIKEQDFALSHSSEEAYTRPTAPWWNRAVHWIFEPWLALIHGLTRRHT